MTKNQSPPAGITNRKIASKLELSESGVSRLRSGDRFPSMSLMQKIQREFGWSVQDQSDAVESGAYHERLEAALAKVESDDEPATA